MTPPSPPTRHLIPDDLHFYFYEADFIVAQIQRSSIYQEQNPSVSHKYNWLYELWIKQRCPWNKLCLALQQLQQPKHDGP